MAADVSVIIPARDRLWCLPRAIESVRGTRCSVEVIVVDDGSTDGTGDWLATQPDVTALRAEGVGQHVARRIGFEASSGAMIRLLDSDDLAVADVIDAQWTACNETGADLIVSPVDARSEETGETWSRGEFGDWDDVVSAVLYESRGWHLGGSLVRRELVERFPHEPETQLCDDWAFLLDLAVEGVRVAVVPRNAAFYTVHPDQLMKSTLRGELVERAARQRTALVRRTVEQLEQRDQLTDRRRRAAARALWTIALRLSARDLRAARDLASDAFEIAPKSERADWPPESPAVRRWYRWLGFRTTERLRHARRRLLRRA